MLKLLSLLTILTLSCSPAIIAENTTIIKQESTTDTNGEVPTSAFAKITKTLNVHECVKDTPCQVGAFRSMGSGVSIGTFKDGSLILTAGHVCSHSLSKDSLKIIKSFDITMEITDIYERTREAKVVHSVLNGAMRQDLCLLFADDIKIDGVMLASGQPKIGERVFAMSAPMGIFHPPTMPILEGRYSGPIPGSGNVMVTVPAIGGSSGSAILDKEMRLIGILFATHPHFNIVTLSSSYEALAMFVNQSFKILLSED